jgi:hypothetical protein
VPTFRDIISFPSSRVKKSKNKIKKKEKKMGPIGCPETSAQNYHSTLRNIPKQHRSQEALCSVLLTEYSSGHQIKKKEIGGECSINGREERFIKDFGGEI